MSGEVTTTAKTGITKYLNSEAMQNYLKSVIGSNKDKFATNLISAVNQNKALQECSNMSLVSGALVATTLNLSLNSSFGYAYLVPYKNKKTQTTEAQFQIGYKGYIQLALRTGEYQRLNAVPIYKSQFQSWNALTEELKLNSFDDFGDDEVVGYVAYFRLNNGFEKTMFWSREKFQSPLGFFEFTILYFLFSGTFIKYTIPPSSVTSLSSPIPSGTFSSVMLVSISAISAFICLSVSIISMQTLSHSIAKTIAAASIILIKEDIIVIKPP